MYINGGWIVQHECISYGARGSGAPTAGINFFAGGEVLDIGTHYTATNCI